MGNVEPPPGDDEHWWKDPCGQWRWIGMPGYSVDELHAALVLGDTPLSYEPAYGPAMDFTAIYQQFDPLPARQTAAGPAGFSHLGPAWSYNWLSYVSDTPGTNNPVTLIYQGFKQTFSNFDPATNTYAPHRDARTTLKRLTVDSYELQLPDGSRRRYVQPDGTTQAGRRVYLTEVSDPQGNTVMVSYGASNRINRITDATSQRWLELAYEYAPNYYRITKVTDNLGRRALFVYNANGRLTGITDAVDLTSSFLYQANASGAPTNFIKSFPAFSSCTIAS